MAKDNVLFLLIVFNVIVNCIAQERITTLKQEVKEMRNH